MADIDIDLADRSRLLSLIQHVPASQLQGDRTRAHSSGVYVTPIPRDPWHGWASIDYQEAENRGYFKIDLLNMSVYQQVRDRQHLRELRDREPDWPRLWQDPGWAGQLVHVGQYQDLLARMRPDSIPRMAAFISVIRPGKAYLQDQPWSRVFEQVWDGDTSRGYSFKKSHSISYAVLVAVHMNLLSDQQPRGNPT